MTNSLQVREVRELAGFEMLRSAWSELLEHVPGHRLFLSPQWHLAAWEWRAEDAELYCLVAEDGQDIIAILPLVRDSESKYGLKLHRLGYLTVPDTQFADMVCRRDVAPAAAEAFANHLAGQQDWDQLQFSHLDKGSMVQEFLLPALRKQGLLASEGVADSNAWLGLSSGWEAYYATRSRRLKKGNNHVGNRLKKQFADIQLERVRVEEAEVNACLDKLVRVSAASWKQSTGLTLDNTGPQAFIRRLTEELAGQGQVVIWYLILDGQAVASEYQLHHEGQIYALRADYDTAFEACSPGTYLFWQILMQVCEEGGERYWMGPGDNPYKARWLENGEPLQRFTVYGYTVRGRILGLLDRHVKPLVHRLRNMKNSNKS
ncbi:MAG: GNAT family N-acetyltransferase [Gammaproteobacteria bacterium]|nr:GNAT family N-acetyltransferase [Gammaproteobacteria bacterium]